MDEGRSGCLVDCAEILVLVSCQPFDEGSITRRDLPFCKESRFRINNG
jgi:hypothetical protein